MSMNKYSSYFSRSVADQCSNFGNALLIASKYIPEDEIASFTDGINDGLRMARVIGARLERDNGSDDA
jgi:vacuolar-type H+-ATPase subunit I/STV1